MDKKILHLTLKRQWFDMILSGEKKEEYREIKPYWTSRLIKCVYSADKRDFMHVFRQFDIIRFKNGYGDDAPTMDVEFIKAQKGTSLPEWSGSPETECYVISLGKIISTQNIK